MNQSSPTTERKLEAADNLRSLINSQESFITSQQQIINDLIRENQNHKELYNSESLKNLEFQNKIDMQETQILKISEENENILNMFQTYSNFYKNQILELENQLINTKLEAAIRASDMMQKEKSLAQYKKKLELSEQINSATLKPPKLSQITLKTPVSELLPRHHTESSEAFTEKHHKNKPNFRSKSSDKSSYEEKPLLPILDIIQIKGLAKSLKEINEEQQKVNALNNGFQTPDKNDKEEKLENDGNYKRASKTKSTLKVVMDNYKRSPSMLFSAPMENIYFLEKRRMNENDEKFWKNEIQPLLEKKKRFSEEKLRNKLQDAIKRFIPSKYRGKVWGILIGNKIKITKAFYQVLCTGLETNPIPANIAFLIKEDLVRTYPNLNLLEKDAIIHKELKHLMELFQFYRPDVGYIQGMAYLGLMFLLHMDKYRAFKCFCNLILGNDYLLTSYSFKMKELEAYFKTFDIFLKEKHPSVLKHFEKYGVTSDVFLIEWSYSLFCRAFPLNTTAKIWDLFLYYDEIILFRTAMAVFSFIEDKIINCEFEDSLFLIRNCSNQLDEELLLKKILNSKLTKEKFYAKLEKNLEKPQILEKSPKN